MIVREANIKDNQGLLALTKKSPMSGGIQLRIDRDPDFFEIIRQRGDYNTFIIEEEDVIVGSWTTVTHPVYINGSREVLHYIRDLKLDPDYKSTTALYRLFKYVNEFQSSRNKDLHLTIALHGNFKSINLVGGRAGLPVFEFVGNFLLNFCLLFPRKSVLNKYQLDSNPDPDQLCEFYDHFYKDYQLGPVINSDQLKGKQNLLLKENDVSVAAITLEDPHTYRRTVVTHFPPVYRIFLSFLSLLNKFALVAKPPVKDEPLKILYIKYAAYSKNQVALRKLIRYALSYAYRNKFHFLCYGLSEKDSMHKYCRRLPGLLFKVHAYMSSLNESRSHLENVKKGVLFEDHVLT